MASRGGLSGRFGLVERRRAFVFLCALVTTVVKLRLAATTAGTNDIIHWRLFAANVHRLGPTEIYSTHLPIPYNHPPLIGWFLVAVNAISSHGPSLRFLIRVPASIADVATALLVFELVRVRRSLTEATAAAAILAVSPVLIVISGFHGNTDPVFVMFILLSAYLVVRDRPFWAGASAAIAVSIKLVPLVALPVIVAGLLRDRRRLIAATVGFLAALLPLWGPAILQQWAGFKQNVLDYKGIDPKDSRWGIVDLARNAHQARVVDLLVGPGRFVVLAISALVPAFLVLKRRDAIATGVGLSLMFFLLLTTNFGTQYLAWAAAGVLLLDLWAGIVYNLSAGLLLVVTYTHWTNGFPWNQAFAVPLTRSEERLGWLVWSVLLVCVLMGIRRLWRWPEPRQDSQDPDAGVRLEVASTNA
ncbi:MAG: glycosyltransferase family 39 protein [Actinomycetota bacterium]|nr:glycosyltransferase family 39 protein [Actinomycetota bacterium]